MQTFLPYPSFLESAKCLDNKRLGKQRVEAKQILAVNLVKTAVSVYRCPACNKIYLEDGYCCVDSSGSCEGFYFLEEIPGMSAKVAWENHPAVLMWRGYELALAMYGEIICKEWIERGFKDSLYPYFNSFCLEHLMDDIQYPNWYVNREMVYNVCISHRSNLVRKFPEHYRKFFWDVPDDYPYYWPTRD